MTEDPRAHSRERFARYAAGYVSSQTHAAGTDLELLHEMAAPQSGWRALDIATGGGHTALKLAPYVRLIVASDLTFPMLTAARQNIRSQDGQNTHFSQVEAGALPFADGVFHLVTCRIAAHHFPDIQAFVRESGRVLAGGGRLVVQDHMISEDWETAQYAEDFERLRDPSHHRAFSKEEWRRAFEEAGLRVERVETVLKRHNLGDWAKRQGCTPETTGELARRLREAPRGAREWLQPEEVDTAQASFANWHILISGVKDPQRFSSR